MTENPAHASPISFRCRPRTLGLAFSHHGSIASPSDMRRTTSKDPAQFPTSSRVFLLSHVKILLASNPAVDVSMNNLTESNDSGFRMEEFLTSIYLDLRRLAGARMAQEHGCITIGATELVHEAYLRLLKKGQMPRWESREHFFAAAAEAMRRILVDRARRRSALKHGGKLERIDFDDVSLGADPGSLDILAINEALERLEAQSPRQAKVVKLRFFAGLTVHQIAEVIGTSETTVDNDWAYARAWLRVEIQGRDHG